LSTHTFSSNQQGEQHRNKLYTTASILFLSIFLLLSFIVGYTCLSYPSQLFAGTAADAAASALLFGSLLAFSSLRKQVWIDENIHCVAFLLSLSLSLSLSHIFHATL
jgi:hypothetical protein